MNVGDRVELHPATDEWMSGDKFGVVVGFGHARFFIGESVPAEGVPDPVRIKLDVSGRVRSFHPDNILGLASRSAAL